MWVLNSKEQPDRLGRAHVSRLDVTGDLVIWIRDRNGGTVGTLVHVFVDVLDGLHRPAKLQVDVGSVLGEQIRVVGHDPAVVQGNLPTVLLDRERLAIIPSAVVWVPVFVDLGLLRKRLWKPLLTLEWRARVLARHARGVRKVGTARTVDHMLDDQLP